MLVLLKMEIKNYLYFVFNLIINGKKGAILWNDKINSTTKKFRTNLLTKTFSTKVKQIF